MELVNQRRALIQNEQVNQANAGGRGQQPNAPQLNRYYTAVPTVLFAWGLSLGINAMNDGYKHNNDAEVFHGKIQVAKTFAFGMFALCTYLLKQHELGQPINRPQLINELIRHTPMFFIVLAICTGYNRAPY